MTVTINDTTMTSDQTAHTARQTPGSEHLWEVSWLPGRVLDRNSAITAMTLADLTSERDLDERHQLWPFIQGWTAELGLTGSDAINRPLPARQPPPAARPGKRAARPRGGTMTTRPRRHQDRKPGPADVPRRTSGPLPPGDDTTAAASQARPGPGQRAAGLLRR